MSSAPPFIGIDFGTSKSAMSWYSPDTRQASTIRNFEGMDETPSVVYLGKSESDVVVGKPALSKLKNGTADQQSLVVSIKRNLLSAPTIVLDSGRIYRPVDIAAFILRKLKEDAENQQFHEPVTRAVITHPATFGPLQQDKLKQAAALAGFDEVRLLPEPVAAALAYGYTASKVGDYILVYDFGGGTFDVAMLARDAERSFTWAAEPKGLETCGGDDLDRELYDYCEEVARQMLHRGISLTSDIDLKFLYDCRERKENLTYFEEETFSSYLPSKNGPVQFLHTLKRTTFEQRITKYIEQTISLTREVLATALANNFKVDTIVLIGGSSRIPLVSQLLASKFAGQIPVQTREWQERDFAVALGAAYYGAQIWPSSSSFQQAEPAQAEPEPVIPPPPPVPDTSYREAVKRNWEPTKKLTQAQVKELRAFAQKLGLSTEAATSIEREITGQPAPEILRQQHFADLARYRTEVSKAWLDRTLTAPKMDYLSGLSARLGLSQDEAAVIERETMGDTKEAIWTRQNHQWALAEYHKAVENIRASNGIPGQAQVHELTARITRLGISKGEAAIIEKQILGDTKEVLWERQRHQNALNEYRAIVSQSWEMNRTLTQAQVNELASQIMRLGLSRDEAAVVERQIMGDKKEAIWKNIQFQQQHQNALNEYRTIVGQAWKPNGMLTQRQLLDLTAHARRLGLGQNEAATIEREIMGNMKEALAEPPTQSERSKPGWKWSASKVFALILLVFCALATIGGFSSSSPASGILFLILTGLCFLWLRRKPKSPIPDQQVNKPPAQQ